VPSRYPFFGVNSTVSGVGYNITKALTTLGHEVRFLSLVGDDMHGQWVQQSIRDLGVDTHYVLPTMQGTSQSVILYTPNGQRMIHVDLKDAQDQTYPIKTFKKAVQDCDLAVLCNVNFTRALLPVAREMGITVASDVHTIGDLHDDYNSDYMRQADILFMSHEGLPETPEAWVQSLTQTYTNPQIVGVGMGAEGALLYVRDTNTFKRVSAHQLRPIVNTIGGGDALFSSFLHGYVNDFTPLQAMQQATLFASYKVGTTGAADGFLTANQLQALYQEHHR
jgi:sugar/nucleoside kinase (ribokinase family)